MAEVRHTEIPGFISEWFDGLQPESLANLVIDPATVAIFSADMVIGFCDSGNLASARVDALTAPVVDLFSRAHDLGVREFVLLQDTHHPDTPEFRAWPIHCLRDTSESEMIPELAALPFRGSVHSHPEKLARPRPRHRIRSMARRPPADHRPRSSLAIAPISAPTVSPCTSASAPTLAT